MGREAHKEMLTLKLFGPFEVFVAGKPLPRLRTRKGQWLLALLALRHEQEVERSWLAGVLWPESLEEQALTNLRISLFDLRRALGGQAYRLQSPSPRTLRLDLTDADVDVLAFDQAIVRGDAASLQAAVALYRGPLLEGCVEEWSHLERQAREQAYLQALEVLAAHFLSKADPATSIGHLRRIVAIDPFRESAQRALMQALAVSGDYGAAVLAYRDLRLRLHQELHSEPDAQTRALFQKIRAQARSAGTLAEDEAQSLAVVSTEKISTPAGSPPVLTEIPGGLPPSNLPVVWSSFIGRQKELEAIRSLLEQTRLLTLAGSGGSGKTRLALQIASELREDFPDGVWLVELAALSDPSLVPQAVASALELREQPDQTLLQSLAQHLQPKRLLLILDNCEHLLADCASLVETLLKHGPHLKILVTSREALRLSGEQVYRVPSLSAPDPAKLPRQEKEIAAIVSEYEAVRLFVERARLQKPEFSLTARNALVVGSICHRLDGMPLAIELAAGRIGILSVEEIVARLEDRFRLLRTGSRTALPRQQTLRAALDWSYDLLSEPERLLLERLSVFAGGWTLEAAETVCGAEDILDLLASLVEKSLVIVEEGDRETRYRLLETIRAYAREWLQKSGTETEWQDRHLAYFLRVAEETELKRKGAGQAQWLERLESEHDNLRTALRWCRQEQERTAAGLRLAGSLWRFWEVRGYLSEGREHLQATLSQDTARSHTQARARALNGAGILAADQGDYAAARALFEERLTISRELGDRQGISAALNSLGNVAWHQGEFEAAKALYEECLTMDREVEDRQGMASTLANLGMVADCQGDYAAARALFEESLAIKRELGDERDIAYVLNNLGNVYMGQEDYATARALYEESLALSRALGDRYVMAYLLNSLGNVAFKQGDYAGAGALYEESLAIRREIGDRQGEVYSLLDLGNAAKEQEDYATARDLCGIGLSISREIGDKQGIGCALLEIADISARQEQIERAARLWAAAETLREAMGASLPPYMQAGYQRKVAAARDSLGETPFESAWEQGRTLTVEEAIDYALKAGEPEGKNRVALDRSLG